MEEWGSPRLVTEGQIQHYESKMKEICLGRKFFTTAEGGMGIGKLRRVIWLYTCLGGNTVSVSLCAPGSRSFVFRFGGQLLRVRPWCA